ncbi:predicted protein [Nematostella vectensis]|uniref:Uncharacterized protein n=1 Tax=Nematostella vectensis TaxID=45351 RepID=A7S8R0_NEMVE|nr:predicted protein [Nematostella vectensis]|eukprot:XP_001631931.1 predicted protein [Nematostella vectensis]
MARENTDSLLFLVRKGHDYIDCKDGVRTLHDNGHKQVIKKFEESDESAFFKETRSKDRKRGRQLLSLALEHQPNSRDVRRLTRAAWSRRDRSIDTPCSEEPRQNACVKPVLHMSVASGYFVQRNVDYVKKCFKGDKSDTEETNSLPRIVKHTKGVCFSRRAKDSVKKESRNCSSIEERKAIENSTVDLCPEISRGPCSTRPDFRIERFLDLTIKPESSRSMVLLEKYTQFKGFDPREEQIVSWTSKQNRLSASSFNLQSSINNGLNSKDSGDSADYLKCDLENIDAKSDSYLLRRRNQPVKKHDVTKRSMSCVTLKEQPTRIDVFMPSQFS